MDSALTTGHSNVELQRERNGWYVVCSDVTKFSTSELVVYALAAITGVEQEELLPLHNTIDTDALDALFAPTIDGRTRTGGQVTFTHTGYTVTVRPGGEIAVRSVTDSGADSAVEMGI